MFWTVAPAADGDALWRLLLLAAGAVEILVPALTVVNVAVRSSGLSFAFIHFFPRAAR